MFYVTPDTGSMKEKRQERFTEGEVYPVLQVQFELDRACKFLVPDDSGKLINTQAEDWLFAGLTKASAKKAGQKQGD